MSPMSMMPAAVMALMTAAMMVAMMLPSISPVLWRYHRDLRATGGRRAGQQTVLLAAGYGSVWTVVSLALVASSAELAPTGMPAMRPSLTPLMTGIIVFCAGLVQCSPWKERRLQRCRECIDARSVAISAWWYGCRLGLDCCASCAAPTAVLFVAGLMDTKTMLVIAAAISAERLAPGRLRIARVTGAVALLAGLFICLQAIAATRFGVA